MDRMVFPVPIVFGKRERRSTRASQRAAASFVLLLICLGSWAAPAGADSAVDSCAALVALPLWHESAGQQVLIDRCKEAATADAASSKAARSRFLKDLTTETGGTDGTPWGLPWYFQIAIH